MNAPRTLLLAAIVLGGAYLARGMLGTDRYELVPAAGGAAYRIDRLRGSVSLCTPAGCRRLSEFVLVPKTGRPAPGSDGQAEAAPVRPGTT